MEIKKYQSAYYGDDIDAAIRDLNNNIKPNITEIQTNITKNKKDIERINSNITIL